MHSVIFDYVRVLALGLGLYIDKRSWIIIISEVASVKKCCVTCQDGSIKIDSTLVRCDDSHPLRLASIDLSDPELFKKLDEFFTNYYRV